MRMKSSSKKRITAEESKSKNDTLSHAQRVNLAVDAFNETEESSGYGRVKDYNAAIKRIALTFELDPKALRQHIEFSARDKAFFDHFSLHFVIDEIEDRDLFHCHPMR